MSTSTPPAGSHPATPGHPMIVSAAEAAARSGLAETAALLVAELEAVCPAALIPSAAGPLVDLRLLAGPLAGVDAGELGAAEFTVVESGTEL